MTEFRSRLETVVIRGRVTETFCLRDMLLVLCVHGSKHVWESLKWLVDVAELIRRNPGLDFDKTLADASESGCRRALLLGLNLAARILGAPVPARLTLLAESDSSVRWMTDQIEDRSFESAPGRAGKARIELHLEDNRVKQARYVMFRLLSPAHGDWEDGSRALAILRPFATLRFMIERKVRRET
jgi:hypothetical protein